MVVLSGLLQPKSTLSVARKRPVKGGAYTDIRRVIRLAGTGDQWPIPVDWES